MSEKEDEIRLRHMLDAAKEAISFVNDKTRSDLDNDRKLTLSLVKCIEIVGEAATKVTTVTRDQYPAIPWGEIITMRHRLIHAYFDIDLDRVWDTLTDDLPPLIEQLLEILESENPP